MNIKRNMQKNKKAQIKKNYSNISLIITVFKIFQKYFILIFLDSTKLKIA